MTSFVGASDLGAMHSGSGVPVKFTPAGAAVVAAGNPIFDLKRV